MDKKELIILLKRKILEDKIYFLVVKDFVLPSESENIYKGAYIVQSEFKFTDDIDTININVLYKLDDIPITFFTGLSVISYDLIANLILEGKIKVFNSRIKGENKEVLNIIEG